MFDGGSYLHRKNHDLLLEAFARSGLAQSGWQLLLKTRNFGISGSDPDHLQRLQQRLNALQQQLPSSIELLDAPLSPQDLLTLMRTSAIYCSPHVSEGFGLTIAEAMALIPLTASGPSSIPPASPSHCNTLPISTSPTAP